MHVSYSGDSHVGDLEKILKGRKGKKSGRRKYDSDEDDSEDELDDIEKKVIGWSTMMAGKQWKCDLAEKDDQGWTSMHWAASRGQVSVLGVRNRRDGRRRRKHHSNVLNTSFAVPSQGRPEEARGGRGRGRRQVPREEEHARGQGQGDLR